MRFLRCGRSGFLDSRSNHTGMTIRSLEPVAHHAGMATESTSLVVPACFLGGDPVIGDLESLSSFA